MLKLEGFVPGLSAVVQKKVEEADTAIHCGKGVLGKLLATPALVDLVVKASSDIVESLMPLGYITVGKSMSLTHEAPSALGMIIKVQSTLDKIEGNRLVFKILVCDDIGEIGHGIHERIVMNEEDLWKKAEERMKGKVPELRNYRI